MNKKITIVFAIFFSIYGCAQQKENSPNNDATLISVAKEIMQSAKTCALVTLDDKGRPRVRTMDPFPPEEELTVWFGTNSNSRKVNQIRENPKVTLYYLDSDDTGYVMIHGIASIVNDNAEKEKHWKVKWKSFYPNYPDDYMLIKVKPEWLEVISETRGILGDEKTWLPPIVTFSEN
ncbi:pyridoxamine 5'-phosphate oxidase family protein [Pontimicrobium sp. SW4]|uniref:Pyridoxamine 5'-phosphate oxidase family protein n=1 Tax=Pontimicrobium sp. SW4 TaxID=3153519 RepID=A0AAU7BU64_9FLAO